MAGHATWQQRCSTDSNTSPRGGFPSIPLLLVSPDHTQTKLVVLHSSLGVFSHCSTTPPTLLIVERKKSPIESALERGACCRISSEVGVACYRVSRVTRQSVSHKNTCKVCRAGMHSGVRVTYAGQQRYFSLTRTHPCLASLLAAFHIILGDRKGL